MIKISITRNLCVYNISVRFVHVSRLRKIFIKRIRYEVSLSQTRYGRIL